MRIRLYLFTLMLLAFRFSNGQNDEGIVLKTIDSLSFRDFNRTMELSDSLLGKTNNATTRGVLLRMKGVAHYFKGRFDSASHYYARSMDQLEKTGAKNELGLTLIAKAKVNRKLRIFNSAIYDYNQSEKIFTELNDKHNLATVFNEKGVVYEYMDSIDKAVDLYKRSLAIREEEKDTIGMAYSYNFIGGAEAVRKNYPAALKATQYAIDLFALTTDSIAAGNSLLDLGVIYLSSGDLKNAIKALNKSLFIANRIGYKDLKSNIYNRLGALYEKQGRYDSALYFQQQYALLKDSLFNESAQKTIAELNVKYETAEKDRNILMQQNEIARKNLSLLIGGAIGLLLLLSGIFYYRNQKLRNERKFQDTLMKQQQTAALEVINAEENERRKMASTLHDNLGQLLSAVKMYVSIFGDYFNNDKEAEELQEKTISLVDKAVTEVRNVSRRLMPEAIMKAGLPAAIKNLAGQFENPNLKFVLEVAAELNKIDANKQLTAFRLVQESVNNAIKHADASVITIRGYKDAGQIFLSVEDNGKGFETHIDGELKGIGLQNMQSRVQLLKGSMQLNSEPRSSTKIEFRFPEN